MKQNSPGNVPSALLHGAISFTVVSCAAFSIWALAGRWFYQNTGETGLYAACAIVFVGLAGILMHPLVGGPGSIARFYKTFIPAFFAYAIAWSVCWMVGGFGKGEWLGSITGALVFALVLRWALGSKVSFCIPFLILFLLHSIGYFAGSWAFNYFGKPGALGAGVTKAQLSLISKMMWGLFYGMGFGAGIGYVYFAFRRRTNSAVTGHSGLQ